MKKTKILILVGTRPNFMKVTQFKKVAESYSKFDIRIVHTSQHYSNELSQLFFRDLNLTPDYSLEIPENLSSIAQMAEIMKKLEELIITQFYPDLIMVVGDVNSTLAGALVANKLKIPLAHVESGLRSFDNTMPEEYNRILTDRMSQFLFITEETAYNNLKYEGIQHDNIFFVGNTMIDTLVAYQDKIDESDILDKLNVLPESYVVLTMHRPGNVDTVDGLKNILSLIQTLQRKYSSIIKNIVFPIHPRTTNNFKKYNLWEELNSIPILKITPPLSYFHFQKLLRHAFCIITDSGGVQEETTYLTIPCITLRPSTERPVTMWKGSNILLPFHEESICQHIDSIIHKQNKKTSPPPYWDGKATERIMAILNDIFK